MPVLSIGFALALDGRFVKAAERAAEARRCCGSAPPRFSGRPASPMRRARRARRHRPAIAAVLRSPRLADALWVAEEAAGNKALAAVVLELRGNPARLDLTATRRLHRRAEQAGRPVFLLRQAAFAEPTAAPVRLLVAPAPAGLRAHPCRAARRLDRPPAFSVTIGKSRTAPAGTSSFWSGTAMSSPLQERQPQDSRRLVSLSRRPSGSGGSAWGGRGVHAPQTHAAARHQPPRQEHASA